MLNQVLSSGGRKPGTPTIGTATAGNAQATVTFTAPSYLGKPEGTEYVVMSTPNNIMAVGPSSPITVTNLANGTSYTFKVSLRNKQESFIIATSDESLASNAVTPVAPPFFPFFPPSFPFFPPFFPFFPTFTPPFFPFFPTFTPPFFPFFPAFTAPATYRCTAEDQIFFGCGSTTCSTQFGGSQC